MCGRQFYYLGANFNTWPDVPSAPAAQVEPEKLTGRVGKGMIFKAGAVTVGADVGTEGAGTAVREGRRTPTGCCCCCRCCCCCCVCGSPVVVRRRVTIFLLIK